MSLKRAATPFASAFCNLSTASASRPAAPHLCLRCLRPTPQLSIPRRHLATATAYQPYTLDTTPPPRNANAPETSISTSQPQPPKPAHLSPTPKKPVPATPTPTFSLNEAEAQTPRPVPTPLQQSAPDLSTSPQPKPRRTKLRPRKAAMTLTNSAVSQLRELLNQPEPQLIRVGVKNRGCSGLAYHLEYVDKPGAFDEAVDQDGVKVLIDSKALFSIIGSEMDWVEDKLSRRFVFRNPNITEQCGCGESFSIS